MTEAATVRHCTWVDISSLTPAIYRSPLSLESSVRVVLSRVNIVFYLRSTTGSTITNPYLINFIVVLISSPFPSCVTFF